MPEQVAKSTKRENFLMAYVDADLKEAFRKYCARRHRNMSQELRLLMEEAIAREKSESAARK